MDKQTIALIIMGLITITNLVLGATLVATVETPEHFIIGIIAWLATFLVWGDIAIRILMPGELPWRKP